MTDARERLVEIAGPRGVLRGVVHGGGPEPARRAPLAAVLLQGYFTSTHVGPARLYVQVGRMLARAGVALWRVDPFGVGDSEGDFQDASYASELADHRAVVAHAAQHATRVLLIGHSLGASMALRIAADPRGAPIERVWLLSPGCGPFSSPTHPFDAAQRATLARDGAIERHATHIDRAFVDAMTDPSIYDVARLVRVPTLVTWGSADEMYDRASLHRLLEALRSASDDPHIEVCVIDGADHNAIAPGARARLLETLEPRAASLRQP